MRATLFKHLDSSIFCSKSTFHRSISVLLRSVFQSMNPQKIWSNAFLLADISNVEHTQSSFGQKTNQLDDYGILLINNYLQHVQL